MIVFDSIVNIKTIHSPLLRLSFNLILYHVSYLSNEQRIIKDYIFNFIRIFDYASVHTMILRRIIANIKLCSL